MPTPSAALASAGARVDLNEFEWFYHDSPLGRRRWCAWWPVVQNQCWVGALPGMPETEVVRFGVFVKRAPPRASRLGRRTLEVLRVARAARGGVFTDAEVDVAWFFVLAGSGVFVRLARPPVVLRDRPMWWASDAEPAVVRYLGEEAVVFARSRRGWWGLPVRHARAVLVVPTPPASLRLRAGWRGGRACRGGGDAPLLSC